MQILGVDVGGSGIKGVPVNLEKEEYLGERVIKWLRCNILPRLV